jgi:hypothetical protein
VLTGIRWLVLIIVDEHYVDGDRIRSRHTVFRVCLQLSFDWFVFRDLQLSNAFAQVCACVRCIYLIAPLCVQLKALFDPVGILNPYKVFP